MHFHLIFVTKYRREVFTKAILDELRPIFAAVCKEFEADLVTFDDEDDHVHLLVNYRPKVAIYMLVNSLKRVSSRMRRKKIIRVLPRSCGGAPIAIIRQYIEHQRTPH